jgi:hypothetical protein
MDIRRVHRSSRSNDGALSRAETLCTRRRAGDERRTKSARNVDQLTERVEVGNLSINHLTASFAETPFGGVKDSGYGREGGTEGLECYTVAKNVSHLVL